MRVQLRVVAGSLRRRKLVCEVSPEMRPTPQMVREALFSILGNAVPGRMFLDVFAGTGVNGLEAISRGAKSTHFIERDFRLAQDIDKHLKEFKVSDLGFVVRTDAYRWVGLWRPPVDAVNVFVSPPFPDLKKKPEQFLNLVRTLMDKVPNHSVLVLQSERELRLVEDLPHPDQWDVRHYGRNELLIWTKVIASQPEGEDVKSIRNIPFGGETGS